MSKTGRPFGFMATDVLVGIFLLAAMATLMAVAGNLRYRNTRHLADQRAALQEARMALVQLQSGAQPTAADPSTQLAINHTGTRVGSREWVEVTVIRQGRRSSLVGLVTATDSAPSTQPGGSR
jgi:hypothetical protein